MKKDNKFQITKEELQKIIKEEYASMSKDAARAEEIKARLASINEELGTLPDTLSEVEATGTKKVKATGWTGEGEGDTKYGEKFEKIGSHLKEDDEIEGTLEVGGEEEAPAEPKMGHFEMKLAELGRELDAKIGTGAIADEDALVIATAAGDDEGADMGLKVGDDSAEEVEEVKGTEMGEAVAEEKAVVSEDLEEPIEGDSPAQESDARFNDYMEKDKHVNEGVKGGTKLLSEGFSPEKKSALDRELERMKQLAKLNK